MLAKNKFWVLFSLLSAFLIPLNLKLLPYIFDDAYIHARIALHLAQAGQPYYNLTEPINASSSSVWIILLAILFKIAGGHLWLICIFNALLTAAGTVVFVRLISELMPNVHPIFAWLGGLLYLAAVIESGIGGMEIPLAFLLFGTALLLLLHKKTFAFTLFGLLVFIRLEFAALLIFTLVLAFLDTSIGLKKALLFGLYGLIAPILYQLYYFRTIVPNTILAKSLVFQYSTGQTLNTLISSLIPQTWIIKLGYQPISIEWMRNYIFFLMAIWLVTIALHIKKLSTGHIFSILFMGFGLSVVGAYSARAILIFPWYVALYSLPIISALIIGYTLDTDKNKRVINLLFLSPFLFYQMASLIMVLGAIGNPTWYPEMHENARVQKFREIGTILYNQYPGARLMVSDIGGFGYAYPGYIIDIYGLVTPDILPYYAKNRGMLPVEYIIKSNPELIVCLDTVIKDFSDNPASENYIKLSEPMYTQEDLALLGNISLWDNTRTEIYIRKDIANKFGLPVFK